MKTYRKPAGWQGESYRHYLSAKGVRTGKVRSYLAPQWGDVANRAIAEARRSRADYIAAAAYRRDLAERGLTERPATVEEQLRADLEWQKTALRPGVRSQLERMQFYGGAEGVLGLPAGSLKGSLPKNFLSFNPQSVDAAVAVPLLKQMIAVSEAEIEEGRANKTSVVPAKERYLYYKSLLKMVEQGVSPEVAVQSTLVESPNIFGSMSQKKIVELLDDISGYPGVRRTVSAETLAELEEGRLDQVPKNKEELQDPMFYEKKSSEAAEKEEVLSKLPVGGTYVAPPKLTQINLKISPDDLNEEPEIVNVTPTKMSQEEKGAEKSRVASGFLKEMGVKRPEKLVDSISSDVEKMSPEQREAFINSAPAFIEGLLSGVRQNVSKVKRMERDSGVKTSLTKSPVTYATPGQVAQIEQSEKDRKRGWKYQKPSGQKYDVPSDDDYLGDEQ